MTTSSFRYPEYNLPDPGLNFLASEGSIYTYSQLYGFCSKFKKYIEGYDLTENHPLGLMSHSSDEYAFVIAACYLLKIPFLPINPNQTDSELSSQIKQISPAALYVDSDNVRRIKGHPRICVKKEDLQEKSSGKNLDSPSSDAEKRFGYFFTSGSTGKPKVVPLKRRQIMFAAKGSERNFKPGENRYWLLCLPLNHIGGISIILRSIFYGSAVYRMDTFNVDKIRAFLGKDRQFQVASLVPTMLLRLLEDPLFQIHHEFKALLLGGGTISPALIEQSLERGIPIVSSYGMTETCAQIAANPMLQPRGIYYPKRSVGIIFEPNNVQIRDCEKGTVLPSNEIGEIWLKGPQIIDEYYDSNITKEAFDASGWFNTGDIGYINFQGILFIKSRKSGKIVTGGENVDPLEIETVLDRVPYIKKSAVLGIEDQEWGEKIVALIKLDKPHTLDEKRLRKELSTQLSGFKIPKAFVTVDHIPLSPLGKVQRNKLLQIYKSFSQ